MNRLRDDVGEDPIAARGIEMLRGMAPTAPMPEMKRRVWGAIQQQRLRGAATPGLGRLRLGAAVALVIGVASTAGAVIGQRWIFPSRHGDTGAGVADAASRPARVAARGGTGVRANVDEGPNPAAPAPERHATAATPVAEPAPARPTLPSRAEGRGKPRARGHAPRGLTSALSAAPARERTEVLDALVALRRDRDGARAGRLLDAYLAGHPRGVLREEALVLAIEAADVRGDGAAARQLARDYGAAYPQGRFGGYARDHVGSDRP